MSKSITLIFGCHSHQPIGNFDFVLKDAYERAYLPFLEVLERFPAVHMTFHITGPLWDWLLANAPEYVARVRSLVAQGQIEIMGGGYYEPMLCAIPRGDAIAQIRRMQEFCETQVGTRPRGMWLTERVWEPQMASVLAEAGVEYTALDDTHFLYAGRRREDLFGAYTTEDDGRAVKVFPILERLRYLVPFHQVQDTIDFLREHATEDGTRCAVIHDDGEKFGTWPHTYETVYESGWLEEFFEAITANQDWLRSRTYSEYLDSTRPRGRVYIPCASYMEMMEWTLPTPMQHELHSLRQEAKERVSQPDVAELFLRGGYWRNFLDKYEEANNVQKRMLCVSKRLQKLREKGADRKILEGAERLLHEGQCNCAYWHGIFGGLYLNHLRTALYEKLVAADALLDHAQGYDATTVEVRTADYDGDGEEEVLLANESLSLWVKPSDGGTIYEIDYKPKPFNWINTLMRREEAYHRRISTEALTPEELEGQTMSIHEMALVKERGLEKLLVYDKYRRVCLRDRLLVGDVTPEGLWGNKVEEVGGFSTGQFDLKVIENGVQLSRSEGTGGGETQIQKEISIAPGESSVTIRYDMRYSGTEKREVLWGPEFAFNLLAGAADDRYYWSQSRDLAGAPLNSMVAWEGLKHLGLRDEWQDIEVELEFDEPATLYCFPLETVSQSEAGQERVYQGSVILPAWQWTLQADARVQRRITLRFRHGPQL